MNFSTIIYTGIRRRSDGSLRIPLPYKRSHTRSRTRSHEHVGSKLPASTSVYIISSFAYAPSDLFNDDARGVHSSKRTYKAMAYLRGNTG